MWATNFYKSLCKNVLCTWMVGCQKFAQQSNAYFKENRISRVRIHWNKDEMFTYICIRLLYKKRKRCWYVLTFSLQYLQFLFKHVTNTNKYQSCWNKKDDNRLTHFFQKNEKYFFFRFCQCWLSRIVWTYYMTYAFLTLMFHVYITAGDRGRINMFKWRGQYGHPEWQYWYLTCMSSLVCF